MMRTGAAVALGLAAWVATSQSPDFNRSNRPVVKAEAVQYLFPEQIRVPSGKMSPVALHFRISPGLHINSHTPPDQYLISTEFTIPEASGVRLDGADYPAGTDFRPDADPNMKLEVYTGEFTIQARIVATRGNHLVEASLRYQACDQNACMPPKTITMPIDVIGK
jgi:hypothetical protein